MVSLVQLVAQLEHGDGSPASSPNVTNLEKRVVLQQAALDQAISDLAAARAKQGLPELPSLPDLPDAPLDTDRVRATAEMILRAAKKARGEIPMDERPVASRVISQTVGDPAETAAFILAAARKAKSKT